MYFIFYKLLLENEEIFYNEKKLVVLLMCILLVGCSSTDERLPIEDGKFSITAEKFCERYKEYISSNDEYEGISLGEVAEHEGMYTSKVLYNGEDMESSIVFNTRTKDSDIESFCLMLMNLKSEEDGNRRSK